jgi:hypothetical protein
MTRHSRPSPLDGKPARAIALGCFFLAAAALIYVHRDDLFPPEAGPTSAADAPFVKCFSEAVANIDAMLAEKTIKAAQAELFRNRAEARCRAQTGGRAAPPGAPPPASPASPMGNY